MMPVGRPLPIASEPGYRYDPDAVTDAAMVLMRGAGPHDYSTDPRNIVQDVLDIFIAAGAVVVMDLSQEAAILDALTTLALSDAAMEVATAELLAKEATIIDLRAELVREFERGYRQGAQPCSDRRRAVCSVPGCRCNGDGNGDEAWHLL